MDTPASTTENSPESTAAADNARNSECRQQRNPAVGEEQEDTPISVASKPLAGLRVLVCRPAEQSVSLLEGLRAAGAETVNIPVIAITDPEDGGVALKSAISSLASGDWLVVTSPNGASRAAAAAGLPLTDGVSVAAIGPGTALSASEAGLPVHLIPKRSTGEGLLAEFPAYATEDAANADLPTTGERPPTELASPGRGISERPPVDQSRPDSAQPCRKPRVVLARAAVARRVLPEGLRAAGWHVTDAAAYRTVGIPLTDAQRRKAAEADAVVFTSSSAVKHLTAQIGAKSIPPLVVSIGPATTSTAKLQGLNVAVQATEHTVKGLIAALCRFQRGSRGPSS